MSPRPVRTTHRLGAINGRWAGGKASHPLYEIYLDMIGRCSRPSHARFASYGGRGITVSDRWRADFWNFVDDMGDRPGGRRNGRALWSLDRIDNDGGYSADNCRWASYSDQALNKRGYGDGAERRDLQTGRFTMRSVAA